MNKPRPSYMPGQTLSVAGCYYSYPPKGEIPFPGTLYGPLVKWLRHRPFTAVTLVQIRYGLPKATKEGIKIQQGASPYEETAWPSMLKWME